MQSVPHRVAIASALLLLACGACATTPPPALVAPPPAVVAPPAAAQPAPPPITVPAISAAALEERLATAAAPPTLLDVRTPEEFAAGHVPGARNIPVQELDARLAELAAARGGDIVVYCRSGRRAASALATLQAQGFEHLLHLEGDMQGWSAGGHRVETAAPAAETLH
ncbi:MAG: rhodanese-like domain-containing protein [Steroidobacteraceae bacterium]